MSEMRNKSISKANSRNHSPILSPGRSNMMASSTLVGVGAGTLGLGTPAFKINFELGIPPVTL